MPAEAAVLAEITLADPTNGISEVAGPDALPLDELGRRFLKIKHDPRKVVPDVHARYFGVALNDRSLTPDNGARPGAVHFEDWLKKTAG